VGFLEWVRRAVSPTRLAASAPVIHEKPLHEQFQRIGGGLTPQDVSRIISSADSGQPARLYDLANEGRQKDGHIQSVCSTREGAVALCNVEFIGPENGRRVDKKAVDLCNRIVDEFDNWPTLIEHLTSAFFFSHATAEIKWRKVKGGLLLPYRCDPIAQRDFVFSQSEGALRYRDQLFTIEGVDLLAENPGRIIQIQRRIVGDVPAREGLVRLLTWSALFRNWTFRDWIALAEIGWKPWRIGKYLKGASKEDIEALGLFLDEIGSTGTGVLPETAEVLVEWPKNMAPGTGGSGTHLQLFDAVGREVSKAVLGQTTSIESGPNGDRAATETRDQIRLDVRERDAVANAAVLRMQLFSIAVAVNLGDSAVVPVPRFQTDESTDQVAFAEAIKHLTDAGVPVPVSWVRDEIGAPEPKGDEQLTIDVTVVDDDDEPIPDPPDEDGDEEDEAA
jgi:phage gp29-like protein